MVYSGFNVELVFPVILEAGKTGLTNNLGYRCPRQPEKRRRTMSASNTMTTSPTPAILAGKRRKPLIVKEVIVWRAG